MELIRAAKERGVRVTAEGTPHHFTLTEAAADGYRTEAKVNPPLRTEEDRDAVREGIADGHWIARDPDLASLREHPRFRLLLDRMGEHQQPA